MDEDPSNDVLTIDLPPYRSIEESRENLASILRLLVYPDPVKSIATIQYFLSLDCRVCLKIYNPSGRVIKTLIEGKEKKGNRKIIWNGENERGEKVPSGIYFVRLETPNYSTTKKLLFLR